MSRSGYTIDPEEARSRRASRIQSRESSVVPVEELGKINRDHNFWVDIVNHEHLISIINVGTFKFEDQCLINFLKVIPAGYNHQGVLKRNIFYLYTSAWNWDQCNWSWDLQHNSSEIFIFSYVMLVMGYYSQIRLGHLTFFFERSV